ncbi:MAG: 30S ribosome-binding factor RbfA [Hyphomicrobiales bacterium]|nr:30S ribosome-binding factor RbfA [Hyphomicrobiales bacterium]
MSRNLNGKAPSQRQLRVGEIVRHALTQLLHRGEIPDPVIEKTVLSITEVSMSPDLKKATCYVSPLGVKDAAPIVKALNVNVKLIRGRLTPALRQMKYMPSVYFQLDTSFDNYEKIDLLLKNPQVSRDLANQDHVQNELTEE